MLERLDTPMFTQKQVLRMLPDLKAKTLQNWVSRGIIDVGEQKPGKQGKRLYTPLGVIMLDFMQAIGIYGVPPANAEEMAQRIAEAAEEFWKNGPEIITLPHQNNARWIPFYPEKMDSFRRARIVIFKSHERLKNELVFDETSPVTTKSYLQFIDNAEDGGERILNGISIIVEVDFTIAQTINRMFLLEAGVI